MRELALFAGCGGGILGGKLLGWRTICAVEINAFCARRLMQRQNEGHLPPFPIWDDVSTFDGRPWNGIVDVVSGGFPCQDISVAGKGAGITGERSGLWKQMARVICEVRPRFAFVENSPMLTIRGLGVVLGDLAEMGYDAKWGVFSASDAIWLGGIPAFDHERARVFIAASDQRWISNSDQEAPNASKARPEGQRHGSVATFATFSDASRSDWWTTEPELDRMAYGVANRMDRLGAIGNGQVPSVVALAWRTLMS